MNLDTYIWHCRLMFTTCVSIVPQLYEGYEKEDPSKLTGETYPAAIPDQTTNTAAGKKDMKKRAKFA